MFFPILILLVLVLAIILANAIITERPGAAPGIVNYGGRGSVSVSLPPYVYDTTYTQYREDIIVYFKDMPSSIGEFASSYDVTPIFVKDDIKMAAFETSPAREPGVTSQKTKRIIEQISNNILVESVKEDGQMFINKKKEIKTAPEVITPEDLARNGTRYSCNIVVVGFWRYPPSLEDFAAKYGGKLVDLSDGERNLQVATFRTDDMSNFIGGALKDPYVS